MIRKSVAMAMIGALLLSFTLQGCMHWYFEGRTVSVRWHQPEVWESFPDDGTVNGFEVQSPFTYKTASKGDSSARQSIAVTSHGDVRYSLGTIGTRSPEEVRERLLATFEALSLPEPTLDSSYLFPYRSHVYSTIWEQPGIWDAFPGQGQIGYFQVFVQDSLKVAERVDEGWMMWVRADDGGNVSFRIQVPMTREEQAAHYEMMEPGEDIHEYMTALIWDHLPAAFEALGLPEPDLEPVKRFEGGWSLFDPI